MGEPENQLEVVSVESMALLFSVSVWGKHWWCMKAAVSRTVGGWSTWLFNLKNISSPYTVHPLRSVKAAYKAHWNLLPKRVEVLPQPLDAVVAVFRAHSLLIRNHAKTDYCRFKSAVCLGEQVHPLYGVLGGDRLQHHTQASMFTQATPEFRTTTLIT